MHKLSIVERVITPMNRWSATNNTGDRMKYWGKVGAFWAVFGASIGSAFFMIPARPILAADR